MPYTRGLGMLAHTMRVDTPNQSIPPFKATHKVLANHPTMPSALVVHYYTHSPNLYLHTQPTANKYNH